MRKLRTIAPSPSWPIVTAMMMTSTGGEMFQFHICVRDGRVHTKYPRTGCSSRRPDFRDFPSCVVACGGAFDSCFAQKKEDRSRVRELDIG